MNAKRLYIDSFTILSIALTYQYCMEKLARACNIDFEIPTITNFHSYSMNPEMTFEVTGDYIVLISASSSGGLASKLVEKHHARRDRVFHLLIYSENQQLRHSAVFFYPKVIVENSTDVGYQKIISIPGEEFLASHGDTRTIEIGKQHLVESERRIYAAPFYQNVLTLNLRSSTSYGGAYSPVTLKAETNFDDPSFLAWLSEQVHIELPPSTSIVIAADSGNSKRLAELLLSRRGGTKEVAIPLITLSELLSDSKIDAITENGSVLVVCANECDGDSLLAISQTLRERRHLHRHYVIGHLFPSTARQFRRLKKNLCVSGKGKPYAWSAYCVTPIGDASIHESWLQEQQFEYSKSECLKLETQAALALTRRGSLLDDGLLMGSDLFLPKLNGEPLQLRDDSVLFVEGYQNISQVTVYVQIASALQRARDRQLCDDKTVLPGELCFESNPFIDSVIDPDTFSRFNDGIIQAALLRAASAAELNYSRDAKLSQCMMDIVAAVLRSRNRNRGEAVLEFLFAARLKKLRFQKGHYEEVERLVTAELDLEPLWRSFSHQSLV